MALAKHISFLKTELHIDDEGSAPGSFDSLDRILQAKMFIGRCRRQRDHPWSEEQRASLEYVERELRARCASLSGHIEVSPTAKALTAALNELFSAGLRPLDSERLKAVVKDATQRGLDARGKATIRVLNHIIDLKIAIESSAFTAAQLDKVDEALQTETFSPSRWNDRVKWELDQLRNRLEHQQFRLSREVKRQEEVADDPVASAEALLVSAIVGGVPTSYTLHHDDLRTRSRAISLPLDVNDTVKLDYAMETADIAVRGAVRQDLNELYDAAKLIQRFQTTLLEDDLDGLEAIAQSTAPRVSDKAAATAVRETVLLAQHVVRYSRVVRDLVQALSVGSMTGSVGSVDLSTVRTDDLSAGVNSASQIRQNDRDDNEFWFQNVGVTADTYLGSLLEAARLVLAIRTAEVEGRWLAKHHLVGKSVEVLLREVSSEHVDRIDVAKEELDFAMDEVDNRRAIDAIIGKLRSGASYVRVRGDLSDVRTDELNEVVVESRRVRHKSPKLAMYMKAATFTIALRQALQRREWSTMADILHSAPDTPETSREIEASQDLLDQLLRTNERLQHALQSSVKEVTAFDIETLDSAIRYAAQQVCKSDESERLLRSCTLLRDLRMAQREAKGSTKMSDLISRAEASDISEVVLEELALHAKELEEQKAVTALTRALSHGVQGSPGALDESWIVIPDLDNAISSAAGAHRTERIQRLMGAASLMRELRHAILCARWDLESLCNMGSLRSLLDVDGDSWASFQVVGSSNSSTASLRLSKIISLSQDAESVPGILRKVNGGIAGEAVPEIELIERHLCDSVVSRLLKAAIKQKPIAGVGTCDAAPLQESLRLCAFIGSASSEAKSLKVTATLLTSMRQSYLQMNYFGLAAALETACRAEEEGMVHAAGRREITYAMNFLRREKGELSSSGN